MNSQYTKIAELEEEQARRDIKDSHSQDFLLNPENQEFRNSFNNDHE